MKYRIRFKDASKTRCCFYYWAESESDAIAQWRKQEGENAVLMEIACVVW